MNNTNHFWIETEKSDFLKSLGLLARMPKLPRAQRAKMKFIISLEETEMVLSIGMSTVRVPASGLWPTPAVIHYSMLKVVLDIVESAQKGNPITLEALDNHIRIGKAKVPCSFQDPEINLRGIENAEKEIQGVSGEYAPIPKEPSRKLDHVLFLGQLGELYPSCKMVPPEELTLVVIPDIPNLLLRVMSRSVEFRIISDIQVNPVLWYGQSHLWKKFSYPQIKELGIKNLIRYASDAVEKSGVTGNTEYSS